MPSQEHIYISFNLSLIINLSSWRSGCHDRMHWTGHICCMCACVCIHIHKYIIGIEIHIDIGTGIYIYGEVWGQDSSRHKTFILWEGINLSMTFHFHLTFQKTWLNSISWHCNWFSPKEHLSENKLSLDLEVYISRLLHVYQLVF